MDTTSSTGGSRGLESCRWRLPGCKQARRAVALIIVVIWPQDARSPRQRHGDPFIGGIHRQASALRSNKNSRPSAPSGDSVFVPSLAVAGQPGETELAASGSRLNCRFPRLIAVTRSSNSPSDCPREISMQIRRRSVEKRFVIGADRGFAPKVDEALPNAVARAHCWFSGPSRHANHIDARGCQA